MLSSPSYSLRDGSSACLTQHKERVSSRLHRPHGQKGDDHRYNATFERLPGNTGTDRRPSVPTSMGSQATSSAMGSPSPRSSRIWRPLLRSASTCWIVAHWRERSATLTSRISFGGTPLHTGASVRAVSFRPVARHFRRSCGAASGSCCDTSVPSRPLSRSQSALLSFRIVPLSTSTSSFSRFTEALRPVR